MGIFNNESLDNDKLDPRYENSLDVVVLHMIAAGFTTSEIMKQLRVTNEFIKAVCTPGK